VTPTSSSVSSVPTSSSTVKPKPAKKVKTPEEKERDMDRFQALMEKAHQCRLNLANVSDEVRKQQAEQTIRELMTLQSDEDSDE